MEVTLEDQLKSDAGLVSLEKLFTDLMIDKEWSSHFQRGFSWVGSRLLQTINASNELVDDGLAVFKITAQTAVVTDVKSDIDTVYEVLAEFNRYAVGSCYIYDPSARTIRSECWIWLHDEVWEWKTRFFSCFVLTQLYLSELQADAIADALNGIVRTYEHPTSGVRALPDDMLQIVPTLFKPDGDEPSRFADKFEFESLGEESKKSPYAATIGGDEHGIAMETSFGDYTSLSMLTTKIPHPLLGNGLTGLVKIPTVASQEDAYRIVDFLNRAEASDTKYGHQLGAWCFDQSGMDTSGSITYRFFYPNAVYRKGLIFDASYSAIGRARWADMKMNFTPTEPNAWTQMGERLMHFYGLEKE